MGFFVNSAIRFYYTIFVKISIIAVGRAVHAQCGGPLKPGPPQTGGALYSADCCAAFFASHSGTIFSSLEKANAHTAMIASRMAGTMA